MSEILFRGKAIDFNNENTKFVYGQYVQNRNGYFIYTDTWENGIKKYQIILETVGQYIGLTDIYGKKVFEGDIVDIKIADLKKRGVVFYGERAARCGVVESNGTINYSFLQQSLVSMYGIRVVGNIHDNPDLLGGVKNAKKIKRLAYSQAGRSITK